MKWLAEFTGRQRGAIGIFYYIRTTCKGDTQEAATLDLYERFEHLHGLRMKPCHVAADTIVDSTADRAGDPLSDFASEN